MCVYLHHFLTQKILKSRFPFLDYEMPYKRHKRNIFSNEEIISDDR